MSTKTVVVPVADMRREPDHRSERVSQALFGYKVTVSDERNQFDLVQSADGYQGWIAQSFLRPDNSATGEPAAVVSSRWARFEHEDEGELALPFGALIASGGGEDVFLANAESLRMILTAGEVDRQIVRQELDPGDVALSLESSPYLWGGTSSYGYDCSGFVQAVFRRCGVSLPRDSKDQIACGSEVALEESFSGDLIFFPGHVALHLGSLRIIHATRLRGMVAVESLHPDDYDCRHDLVNKVSIVRRVQP
jgi:hypothetical protein